MASLRGSRALQMRIRALLYVAHAAVHEDDLHVVVDEHLFLPQVDDATRLAQNRLNLGCGHAERDSGGLRFVGIAEPAAAVKRWSVIENRLLSLSRFLSLPAQFGRGVRVAACVCLGPPAFCLLPPLSPIF